MTYPRVQQAATAIDRSLQRLVAIEPAIAEPDQVRGPATAPQAQPGRYRPEREQPFVAAQPGRYHSLRSTVSVADLLLLGSKRRGHSRHHFRHSRSPDLALSPRTIVAPQRAAFDPLAQPFRPRHTDSSDRPRGARPFPHVAFGGALSLLIPNEVVLLECCLNGRSICERQSLVLAAGSQTDAVTRLPSRS